ncbi:MAG TPA: hypothetical protein VMG58_03670 [Candidatus Sulfotelmatobacter sp.]|nr:hypothetical protein [Candidatus Sulfotelmatobacter sp.]
MSYTAACYTKGCGWKREHAETGREAKAWGQWHEVAVKLKTGQRHETTFFEEGQTNPLPEPSGEPH